MKTMKIMVSIVLTIMLTVLLMSYKSKDVEIFHIGWREERYVMSGLVRTNNGWIIDIDRLWELEREAGKDRQAIQIYFDQEEQKTVWVYSKDTEAYIDMD